ncbi:MAG: hypothetical protein ACYC61_06830 [Isosphaeraceae bacterium]
MLARRIRLGVLAILIASAGACGPTSGDRELPKAAKQSLARKKVDVQPRSPSKKATPGR